jgi:hypothetical protein
MGLLASQQSTGLQHTGKQQLSLSPSIETTITGIHCAVLDMSNIFHAIKCRLVRNVIELRNSH